MACFDLTSHGVFFSFYFASFIPLVVVCVVFSLSVLVLCKYSPFGFIFSRNFIALILRSSGGGSVLQARFLSKKTSRKIQLKQHIILKTPGQGHLVSYVIHSPKKWNVVENGCAFEWHAANKSDSEVRGLEVEFRSSRSRSRIQEFALSKSNSGVRALEIGFRSSRSRNRVQEFALSKSGS